MKRFLKGAVVVVGVMIVRVIIEIIINMVCKNNGIELNSTVMDMAFLGIGILSGLLIYESWTKNEKGQDGRN